MKVSSSNWSAIGNNRGKIITMFDICLLINEKQMKTEALLVRKYQGWKVWL